MTAEIWQLRLFPLSSEGQPPSLLVQPAQVPARRKHTCTQSTLLSRIGECGRTESNAV